MNWRKTNKELAELHKQSPWLYMIEWRERLDRCTEHLHGGFRGMSIDESRYEAARLREAAVWINQIADAIERRAGLVERVAALRHTEGRTPEEAAIYVAKADAIEAELG